MSSKEQLSWGDIERVRVKAGMTRVDMCRAARISESTVTRGLQRRAFASRAVREKVLKVLSQALVDKAAFQGANHE